MNDIITTDFLRAVHLSEKKIVLIGKFYFEVLFY